MRSHVTRRRFLAAASASVAAAGGLSALSSAAAPGPAPTSAPASRPTSAPAFDESAYDWCDVRDWGVEGKGFDDTAAYFDRLPARAEGVVRPPVWQLSRHTAGMSADFEAETHTVAVRYTLTKADLDMPHMPATGVSGVDLYTLDGERWRWVGNTRPAAERVAANLIREMSPVRRRYRAYLPLYNGVKSLEFGVPKGMTFSPVPPRRTGAVVYYGTSIAQGGCASRPGMVFTSILSRRLDRPFVNLSFSGNGRMEESVGRFIAELDPAAFVIDCLPNMNTGEVNDNCEPLVRRLREARPEAPIVLVEDRTHDNSWLVARIDKGNVDRRRAMRKAYDRLVAAGLSDLHYIEGDDLTGTDGEATVDGSHPTDLGMMRYADVLEPRLRQILGTT